MSVSEHIDLSGRLNGRPCSNEGRRMMSRKRGDNMRILASIPTGEHKAGACACCYSPTCCPACSSCCICCDDAPYVIKLREKSKYFYVRENSIEWNDPEVVWTATPDCCLGIDPCLYTVQDRITVLYFDDPIFESMSDRTRYCNECRTCCFGGRGERITASKTCCLDICYRATSPCCCVPTCFPKACCPHAVSHEIYVEDAAYTLHEVKKAYQNTTKQDPFYQDIQDELDLDDGEDANGRYSGEDNSSKKNGGIKDDVSRVIDRDSAEYERMNRRARDHHRPNHKRYHETKDDDESFVFKGIASMAR